MSPSAATVPETRIRPSEVLRPQSVYPYRRLRSEARTTPQSASSASRASLSPIRLCGRPEDECLSLPCSGAVVLRVEDRIRNRTPRFTFIRRLNKANLVDVLPLRTRMIWRTGWKRRSSTSVAEISCGCAAIGPSRSAHNRLRRREPAAHHLPKPQTTSRKDPDPRKIDRGMLSIRRPADVTLPAGAVFSILPLRCDQTMLRIVEPPDVSATVTVFPQIHRSLLKNHSISSTLLNVYYLVLCFSPQHRTLRCDGLIQYFRRVDRRERSVISQVACTANQDNNGQSPTERRVRSHRTQRANESRIVRPGRAEEIRPASPRSGLSRRDQWKLFCVLLQAYTRQGRDRGRSTSLYSPRPSKLMLNSSRRPSLSATRWVSLPNPLAEVRQRREALSASAAR